MTDSVASFSPFLTCSPKIRKGDLVRVDPGLDLLVIQRMRDSVSCKSWRGKNCIDAAIFLGGDLVHLGIDADICPIILLDGEPYAVLRGKVTRAV
jgi:hypothetical protein